MARPGKFFGPLQQQGRWLAMLLLCATANVALAQTSIDDNSADPPTRVARLSYVDGDLGFLPVGATDWSDANLNRPLIIGDRLSSSQGARAELEFGGSTLRMDGATDVGVLDLNDQLTQIELTQGSVNLSVRHLDEGQSYEIDTPTLALVINQPGTFRVDADGNGTQVTAIEGDATVYGDNNAQRAVYAGRSYHFDAPDLASVTVSDLGRGDGFDAWNDQRNQRYAQSDSSQYVSDDVVGYQDLDQYGNWQQSSDYGAIWYPNQVASDWAPYRDGHWAYIAPWGWTWVDDSAWGYAPYHYGRWAYTPRGWGWIPGPRDVRPIYAPALVAFVGGGGWSIGVSSGPVGWFPLGPGEIYNPWYHASRGYYTNINVRNLGGRRGGDYRAAIDNHYDRYRQGLPPKDGRYANRDAPRGFTAVPGGDFSGGRNVRRNLVQVDARARTAAPMLNRNVNQFRPNPDAAVMARNAHVRSLPAGGFNRDVVARHAPPTPTAQTMTRPERAGGSVRAAPSQVRLLDSRPAPAPGVRANVDAPRAAMPSERFARPISNGDVTRQPMDQGRQGTSPAARFQRVQPDARTNAAADERVQRYQGSRNV